MAMGKDTAADHLIKALFNKTEKESPWDWITDGWGRAAFGDAVKETYMKSFNLDRAFIEEWKRKDDPPPGFIMNVRRSLQWIGDGFRQIRASIWIDKLFTNHKHNVIISDGRYFSELDAVRERKGINVAIWRPGFENDIDHPSEAQLKPEIDKLRGLGIGSGPVDEVDDSVFDYFLVNNGSVEDLYKKVENELLPFVKDWYVRT
jgi:hypothetical protein